MVLCTPNDLCSQLTCFGAWGLGCLPLVYLFYKNNKQMKKVKLTHLETFLLPFWSINYKRRDSLCVRFPNSQFSSRKSCVHPSQGVRPFIINHLDWCSKENILIWLGKIFFFRWIIYFICTCCVEARMRNVPQPHISLCGSHWWS